MSARLGHLQKRGGFNRLGKVFVLPDSIKVVMECMRKSCVPPQKWPSDEGYEASDKLDGRWGMRAVFPHGAHVWRRIHGLIKNVFQASVEGDGTPVSASTKRMTHQIRIATIICPAFCRRQSDLEREATIPDLFLELRQGHLEDHRQQVILQL